MKGNGMDEFKEWFKSHPDSSEWDEYPQVAKDAFEAGQQSRQTEVDEKDKRIESISLLVISLRNEFDLHGGGIQMERQIELLEEALRGNRDKHFTCRLQGKIRWW